MQSAAEGLTERCDRKSVFPAVFVFSPSLQTDPTPHPIKQTTVLLSRYFLIDFISCSTHYSAVIIALGPFLFTTVQVQDIQLHKNCKGISYINTTEGQTTYQSFDKGLSVGCSG